MDENIIPMSRRAALAVLGAAFLRPAAARAEGLSTQSGRAFGTMWRLTSSADAEVGWLSGRIGRLFSDIDITFSPWRQDGLIARFNGLRTGGVIEHADLAHVTGAALGIARASEGAFDPTVGPLVARMGFGPIRSGGAPDWRGLVRDGDTVGKSRPDLTLDLCGIAKGWALDRAAALIEDAGTSSFLLELGGEFVARGRHPSGRDWRLAVETPGTLLGAAPTLRLPAGTAAATSGHWAQSYRLNGRVYSHIVSIGGIGLVTDALRSVTVLAADAMTADGWATALCAAGAEAGPDIAGARGIAAVFLIEEDGRLRQIETGPIREFRL